MNIVQEQYSAVPLGASGNIASVACKLGGFLCVTSGTLALTSVGAATTFVAEFPVVAGVFYPLPFSLTSAAAVLGSGATGTFAVLPC
jgi:NADH:ubiquinone oxidoreductase subunit 4 (subunit M)